MVSRDALNIEGLSEATLEKFIARGFIHEPADIFRLDRHREEVVELEGFGEKSYENLMANVEKARNTTLAKVIYSLGIPNIGLAGAKLICREFGNQVDDMLKAKPEELAAIDRVGDVIAESFVTYFQDEGKRERFFNLLSELVIAQEERADEEQQTLKGKVFVITGSLNHFSNRTELKELIESRGGKVTGSVTGKTDYLINNDTTAGSSKNKKAKELGVAIISEEEFLTL